MRLPTRLALLLLLATGTDVHLAHADAVPPPLPLNCAKGTTLVHGHGGTRCVPVAPTNCPAGWVGVLGGQCVLNLCVADDSCPSGLQCKPADLCATEGMGYRFGTLESRGPMLAAPPAPQWMISYTDVCGESKACASGASCTQAKVCLPPGATRPAARPPNGGTTQRPGERGSLSKPSVEAGMIAPSVTSSAPLLPTSEPTIPPQKEVTPPPAVPPPGRGGAGCNSFGTETGYGFVALLAAFARLRGKRR